MQCNFKIILEEKMSKFSKILKICEFIKFLKFQRIFCFGEYVKFEFGNNTMPEGS